MKYFAIFITLTCLIQPALADDLDTPTPTPTPIYRPLHSGPLRRQEQAALRTDRQAAADSRVQTRAQMKADRAAAVKAQSQARQAARAREQAQRAVAAENSREARTEKPRPTSDLMTRMGFSEKEIADQKAREQSASAAPNATPTPASPRRD